MLKLLEFVVFCMFLLFDPLQIQVNMSELGFHIRKDFFVSWIWKFLYAVDENCCLCSWIFFYQLALYFGCRSCAWTLMEHDSKKQAPSSIYLLLSVFNIILWLGGGVLTRVPTTDQFCLYNHSPHFYTRQTWSIFVDLCNWILITCLPYILPGLFDHSCICDICFITNIIM